MTRALAEFTDMVVKFRNNTNNGRLEDEILAAFTAEQQAATP